MLRAVSIISLLTVVGASSVSDFDRLTAFLGGPAVEETVEIAAPVQRSAGVRYGDLVIEADAQGHFRVEANISGQRLAMMVDTGATAVALRAGDARRIGVHPAPADYTVAVETANGTVKAARVVLPEVSVGSVRVSRVQALVLPDHVLGTNLLGMTFLSRTNGFEISGGRMVLSD